MGQQSHLVGRHGQSAAQAPAAGDDDRQALIAEISRHLVVEGLQVILMPRRGGLQGSVEAGCVNTAAIAEDTHNLLAFGTSKGTVELFDPRVKSRVAVLEGLEGEVTCLDFNPYRIVLFIISTSSFNYGWPTKVSMWSICSLEQNSFNFGLWNYHPLLVMIARDSPNW